MIALIMPTHDPLWHVYDADRSNVQVRNALVMKYRDWLQSLCNHLCVGNAIDRQSVYEAGVFALIKAVEKFQLNRYKFTAYARQCCSRAMFADIQAQKPHCTLQDDVCEAERPAADPNAFAAHIASLGLVERFVVTLRCWLDMPFSQIGLLVGLSEGAARLAWHRSRKALRHRVASE